MCIEVVREDCRRVQRAGRISRLTRHARDSQDQHWTQDTQTQEHTGEGEGGGVEGGEGGEGGINRNQSINGISQQPGQEPSLVTVVCPSATFFYLAPSLY